MAAKGHTYFNKPVALTVAFLSLKYYIPKTVWHVGLTKKNQRFPQNFTKSMAADFGAYLISFIQHIRYKWNVKIKN